MLTVVPNFSLLTLNTFGMDVSAAYFSQLKNIAELANLRQQNEYKNGLFLLGGGSNILFTQNVDKWVLQNKITGIEKIKEDDSHIWIKAGAGEVWHDFVLYCVQHNYGGVENLSLIPGTVGASPIQNIGAYGVEIKDVMEELECWNLATGQIETYTNTACAFGYRDSIFKRTLKGKIIITSVVFKLNKQPVYNISYGNIQQELEKMGIAELSIKAVSDAVINIRTSKLPNPKEIGNAGSFFKNPEIDRNFYGSLKETYPTIPGYVVSDELIKVPAGWLIEQCNWKGFREGEYGVHKNQALVLVNYGKASGADIDKLSLQILESVKRKFGIELEREVQIV